MTTIETNLNIRIAELEQTLREIREACIGNLVSPGNEDDTLLGVIDGCTYELRDGYQFDYDVEVEKAEEAVYD